MDPLGEALCKYSYANKIRTPYSNLCAFVLYIYKYIEIKRYFHFYCTKKSARQIIKQ